MVVELTMELLLLFESSPVAMLETDSSTSCSFRLCVLRIFCSETVSEDMMQMRNS
jgi:hypothetical protein